MGDYPTVAAELIPHLGATLVEACAITDGTRVLDVATGCGNAALPAAMAGASVVACDLTPELLAVGREQAAALGVNIEWREADAEALPFADDEFDVVLSCLGVMFAPRHQICADELLRVCRPGGTIGLISWTPEGFIGEMFGAMKPYAPPPPPAVQPPPRWGSEEHLLGLFGDRVEEVRTRRDTVTVERFSTPEEFCDYFKECYGPTVAAYRAIAGDASRVAALDSYLVELARRHDRGEGTTVMDWEYLLATARKSQP